MKINKIFKKICNLKLKELYELCKKIKDKFKINEYKSVKNSEENKQTKNKKFNITIEEIGSSKIETIKLIKEITKKNLIESKKMIDSLPNKIIENLDKKTFENIKNKFEKIGCKVKC
ncbi:MAG: ribosomal protein L7/L12 [Candidatus Vidania fulgoroideorum]